MLQLFCKISITLGLQDSGNWQCILSTDNNKKPTVTSFNLDVNKMTTTTEVPVVCDVNAEKDETTKPATCSCKPGYAGPGTVCGLDEDNDDMPDTKLSCSEDKCRKGSIA